VDGVNALVLQRLAHRLKRRGVPVLPLVLHRLIFLLFNCSLPPDVRIGEGSHLGYGGMGVVIHPDAVIGRGVFISPQVTIGGRSGDDRMPVVEDGAYLSAGAKILGPITVGAGSFVGANAVVIRDVAPGTTVGGVPARVLKETSDAAAIIAKVQG
jgi:serine O-acetyltransferase